MSQDMSEMIKAWEESQERQMKESVKLPKRFYDVRKRPSPTRKRVGSFHGITPQGEAMWAKREGLDKKVARKPKGDI